MKSRITTYLLIVAAVAVWGFVVYRIFEARPDPPAMESGAVSYDRQAQPPREDTLLLNYLDPFLKNVPTEESKERESDDGGQRRESRTAAPYAEPTSAPEAPPIGYAGRISTGVATIYLLEHAGLLHSLSVGEQIEGFTLEEAFVDSVKLRRGEWVFTIHIKD